MTVDETTAQVRRAALRKSVRVARQRSAFETWAWSPVIVLRIALVIIYLGYVYASIIAFLVGIPIFDLLRLGPGYTSVWALLIGASSLLAAIGSLREPWERRVEKWAAMLMACLLLLYVGGMNLQAYGEGDLRRMFVGAIAFIAWVLPTIRFVYLAAQTGKRPATQPDKGATEGDTIDGARG